MRINLDKTRDFIKETGTDVVLQNLLTVVPVVGLLSRVEDFKPVINEDEVDAMFDAPLEMFLEVC